MKFKFLYLPLYNIELAAPPTRATATPSRVSVFISLAIFFY